MARRIDTIRKVRTLRRRIATWRGDGQSVALVPTMGALHEGHLSLVRLAKQKADRTVVSIFVNPTQFAPSEDLDTYPREEAKDRAKLVELGVDLIYAPVLEEMYPDDFSTTVHVAGISEGLCGISRPHFFGGVATVVCKLLLQCLPDIAVFGQKDYQQLLVIKRLVRDLDIPVSIVGGPLIREPDGLALSSRNQYLSDKERRDAPLLYRTMSDMASDLADGRPLDDAMEVARNRLESAGFEIDYLEVRDGRDLTLLSGEIAPPARVFAAAMLGKTRLIDNVAVPRRKRK